MAKHTMEAEVIGVFGLAAAGIAFAVACCAAWITHVVWIVTILAGNAGATAGQIALGAIGAFFPPVGVIHGFLLWLS